MKWLDVKITMNITGDRNDFVKNSFCCFRWSIEFRIRSSWRVYSCSTWCIKLEIRGKVRVVEQDTITIAFCMEFSLLSSLATWLFLKTTLCAWSLHIGALLPTLPCCAHFTKCMHLYYQCNLFSFRTQN